MRTHAKIPLTTAALADRPGHGRGPSAFHCPHPLCPGGALPAERHVRHAIETARAYVR